MILRGGHVLLSDGRFHKTDIVIKGQKIVNINGYPEPGSGEIIDISGLRIIPGLIDMHIHGWQGHYTMDRDAGSLVQLTLKLVKAGVTSFVPTTTAASHEDLITALSCLKDLADRKTEGATVRGIYMEGPFISSKYKGALLERNIKAPDAGLVSEYIKASGGLLKIMAIAPELPNACDVIRFCYENGIIPSIAHTAADYITAQKAISAGAEHVTHLFNAMADPRHREPGVMGALLDSKATAEIICDLIHVHTSFIRMMYRLLGRERLILISDNNPISGLGDGVYTMDGMTSVVKNGICRLEDGTINGNVQPLFSCVINAAKAGIPFESAIYMATAAPAKRLGIFSETGSIEKGKDADLLVINECNKIVLTVVKGRIINADA